MNCAPISDINFYTDEAKSKLVRREQNTISVASPEEKEMLLSLLSNSNKKIVSLSLFARYNEPFIVKKPAPPLTRLPISLYLLFSEENKHMSPESLRGKCADIAAVLKYDEDALIYVEECTRTQASSAVWYDQRV